MNANQMEEMKKDIEHLKKIQDLDSEIYGCRQLMSQAPEEMQRLDAQVESERKTLRAVEEELRAVQLKQKDKEANLADKETNIKKYEAQLAQVKTNKEYASLQSEIRSLKADNSLLEEGIIELFDQIDKCQLKLKEEQAKIAAVEKEAREKKAALEAKVGEVEKKIGGLAAQKKELVKEVNPETASLYEKIVVNKRGLALVKIDGEVCSACQMRLRPQQINEIQMGEHVVLCEQCSRILYIE